MRHLLTHTSGIPEYTVGTVHLHREYTEDQLVRLAAGPADPVAARIPAALRWIASEGAETSSATASFRRFAAPGWRHDLKAEVEGVRSWEVVACEPVTRGMLYLNTSVARTCYIRGTGADASLVASVYYSDDARIAGIETYDY